MREVVRGGIYNLRKISNLQRTNQYNLRSGHWFVRCNLQIFSGCGCDLEQRHEKIPSLFPTVFGINNILQSFLFHLPPYFKAVNFIPRYKVIQIQSEPTENGDLSEIN